MRKLKKADCWKWYSETVEMAIAVWSRTTTMHRQSK